jgi:DNA polymerase-1
LLLQVHDEIVLEAPKERAEEIAKALIMIMQNTAELSIPLKVEAGIGHDWGEIH